MKVVLVLVLAASDTYYIIDTLCTFCSIFQAYKFVTTFANVKLGYGMKYNNIETCSKLVDWVLQVCCSRPPDPTFKLVSSANNFVHWHNGKCHAM